MANEFYDLFNQIFLSTNPWGYIGVAVISILCLACASKIKYAWFFGVMFQGLTAYGYVTAGASYQWHIVFLVISSLFTVLVGNEKTNS